MQVRLLDFHPAKKSLAIHPRIAHRDTLRQRLNCAPVIELNLPQFWLVELKGLVAQNSRAVIRQSYNVNV